MDVKANYQANPYQNGPPSPPSYQQGPGSYPPPGPGPQPMHMQPPPLAQQKSAAQIGEEYRAQLYAQCAQGVHQPKTNYGMCGIITAILCFPCGLICLFSDTEQVCSRCGVLLSKK